MSQIQRFGIAGVGPAGPILTLTGDNGVAVPPTLGTIDVSGTIIPPISDSSFGLVKTIGNAVASRLSVVPLTDILATVDASVQLFPNARFTLDPDSSIVFSANIIGNVDDYSAACGGYITGVVRKQGVNPPVFAGTNPLLSRDSLTGKPIFGLAISGDDVIVAVQGVAAENWFWTCSYQWVVQVNN